MSANARSAATSIRRSAGSNSTQSTMSTRSPSRMCSSRRSPWPSRTSPAGGARIELVPERSQLCAGGPLEPRDRGALGPEPVQRGEVVVERALDRLGAGGAPVDLGCRVEGRQPRARGRGVLGPGRVRAQPRGERRRLVVAPHLDREVDGARVALVRESQPVARPDQRPHAEVQLGREPAVERHLLAAEEMATLGRPVVEERQHDRLLDLVRAVRGQEDPGDVGLAHLAAVGVDQVRPRGRRSRGREDHADRVRRTGRARIRAGPQTPAWFPAAGRRVRPDGASPAGS